MGRLPGGNGTAAVVVAAAGGAEGTLIRVSACHAVAFVGGAETARVGWRRGHRQRHGNEDPDKREQ